MPFNDILYTVDSHVATITLNRPEKLNAASWNTWAEVESAVQMADDDDSVRAVLVRGSGRGFCAGSDLTNTTKEDEWHPRPVTGRREKYRTRFHGPGALYNCSKPTIAAIHGVAVGAGFSFALAADIRITREDARFAAIFTKRGISADTGTTWFLPRRIGSERALDMLYTGRMVRADEALRIGLVSQVHPEADFEEAVTSYVNSIANGPTLALEIDKRLVRESLERSLEDQVELEQFMQRNTSGTEDSAEGRRAFIEKREPQFKGR